MLLKRFVCGRCGATGPISSAVPYLICASCGAIGDYDWGIARAHAQWAEHEAERHARLAERDADLQQAATDANRRGWSAIYAGVLREMIAKYPALYPRGIDLERFVEFQTSWQMARAIEPELLDADLLLARLRARLVPSDLETVWSLVDATRAQVDAADRICARLPPGPPDELAPNFIRRVGIAATIADLLPELAPDAQRELIARLGVEHEYVEAHARCRNCGGAIVDDVATCPYCGSAMREARAGFAGAEASAAAFATYDRALAQAVELARQPVQRIEVLDGVVPRDGGSIRLVTLLACFPGRIAMFFESAGGATEDVDALLAWVEHCAIPSARLAYREHPRWRQPIADGEELARRARDIDPQAPVRSIYRNDGFCYEVVIGDACVRMLADSSDRCRPQVCAWRRRPVPVRPATTLRVPEVFDAIADELVAGVRDDDKLVDALATAIDGFNTAVAVEGNPRGTYAEDFFCRTGMALGHSDRRDRPAPFDRIREIRGEAVFLRLLALWHDVERSVP